MRHPGVDGVTFTGSSAVGMSIIRSFASSYPKPAICEMGGKNPVIVTAAADLDLAAAGTARSAFSYAGQKCSAASRVFVDASVADEFVARLVEQRRSNPPVGPLEPGGFLSPVVNAAAVDRYTAVVDDVLANGEVLCGGRRITDGDLAAGNFVAPTVVLAPDESSVWTDELFVPLLAVRPVASLDEALQRANAVPFGLTAGLFSDDQAEIEQFLGGDRGRRRLRQPGGRRNDRRLAGRPAVRRLEAVGDRRKGRWWSVLPPAVPPRAVAHRCRCPI